MAITHTTPQLLKLCILKKKLLSTELIHQKINHGLFFGTGSGRLFNVQLARVLTKSI